MLGATKKIQTGIILLQGGFTGVLLGQMVHLFTHAEPLSLLFILVGIFLCGMGALLAFFKRSLPRYLFTTSSFVGLHFISCVIYGSFLLLFLLPVLFHFEENPLIIYTYQVSSLLALVLVVAENEILHLNILQNVYADLFLVKRISMRKKYIFWVLSLVSFAVLSICLHGIGENSLARIKSNTLYMGGILFVILVAVKITYIRLLGSLKHFQQKDTTLEKDIPDELERYGNVYYIEKNLLKAILEAERDDRSMIYEKIRQMPLIDKVEELEAIRKKYLPEDKDLYYTISSLQRLKADIVAKGVESDVDSIRNIMELRAHIRMDSIEGSPMLVQKLLNDNRPEVKKAAILATVYFNDSSFIPALINLLKDHEYAFSAKEALYELGPQCLPYLRSAKYRNKDNSFFIDHCLDLVESYRSNEARDFLVEMLNEPVKIFQYKAAMALLKCGYPLSNLQKTQILHFIETLIGIIAMEREVRLAIEEADGQLVEALEEEERHKKALAAGLLEAFLPKAVVRRLGELAGEQEKYRFSIYSLIDLYFPLTLRNKCKILLGSSHKENIAPALQLEYLNEQIWYDYTSKEEALKQILKMDYGQIGFWLRACALKELAAMPGQQISLLILSEVFNNNTLLQEVACEVLYRLNYDYYFLQLQRLPASRGKDLKYKIEAHMGPNGDVESQLLFYQVFRLREISILKEHTYESLARKMMLFSYISFDQTNRKVNFDHYKSVGYWIVCQGEFTLFHWGDEVLKARRGSIINMAFLLEAEPDSLSLSFDNEIKVYFMEYNTFNRIYLKPGSLSSQIIQPKLALPADLSVA